MNGANRSAGRCLEPGLQRPVILGDAKAKPLFDGTVHQSEVSVHGCNDHGSDDGKWKGREVRCQSVNIKIRALGINRPSVEFCPLRWPAVSLQFGQFVKHVTVP